MAWITLLITALAFGAEALRTSYTVGELRDTTARNSLLQEKYLRVSSKEYPSADDVDPSLLYPAYNLSVPIDHFHNDSLYEPHVSSSRNCDRSLILLAQSSPVGSLLTGNALGK